MKGNQRRPGFRVKEHKPWKGPTKFKMPKHKVWKKPPKKESTTE